MPIIPTAIFNSIEKIHEENLLIIGNRNKIGKTTELQFMREQLQERESYIRVLEVLGDYNRLLWSDDLIS